MFLSGETSKAMQTIAKHRDKKKKKMFEKSYLEKEFAVSTATWFIMTPWATLCSLEDNICTVFPSPELLILSLKLVNYSGIYLI